MQALGYSRASQWPRPPAQWKTEEEGRELGGRAEYGGGKYETGINVAMPKGRLHFGNLLTMLPAVWNCFLKLVLFITPWWNFKKVLRSFFLHFFYFDAVTCFSLGCSKHRF